MLDSYSAGLPWNTNTKNFLFCPLSLSLALSIHHQPPHTPPTAKRHPHPHNLPAPAMSCHPLPLLQFHPPSFSLYLSSQVAMDGHQKENKIGVTTQGRKLAPSSPSRGTPIAGWRCYHRRNRNTTYTPPLRELVTLQQPWRQLNPS